MSGRRLRKAISEVMVDKGASTKPAVVIAGLSNIYSDYIVTYEEYQVRSLLFLILDDLFVKTSLK